MNTEIAEKMVDLIARTFPSMREEEATEGSGFKDKAEEFAFELVSIMWDVKDHSDPWGE